MGYTTKFKGTFALDRPLQPEDAAYLRKFSDTRRMARDATKADRMPDPDRRSADLPMGDQGGYFVGGGGFAGQEHDASILDFNREPRGQPGLWCKWAPTKDGAGIEWNGAEKFYDYVEWLQYICDHFLEPWGYTLSGKVRYQGEDKSDKGDIQCVRFPDGKHQIHKSGSGRR